MEAAGILGIHSGCCRLFGQLCDDVSFAGGIVYRLLCCCKILIEFSHFKCLSVCVRKLVVCGEGVMGRFGAMSIRRQMILLVVVMAIVPLGIIAYSVFNQRTNDLREARLIVERLANEVANDQKALIAGSEQLLSTLAYVPAVQQRDVTVVNSLFADLIKHTPQITNILMIDSTGLVWASALPMRGTIMANDRRFFKNVMATGRFSSGEYTVGRVLNRPALSFGYPITDASGRIRDIATVAFTVTKYAELLKITPLSRNTSLQLTDHKGTILFASPSAELIGKQDREDLSRRMANGPDEGSFEAVGNTGVRRIFYYKKLRLGSEATPYMYVRAGIAKQPLLSRTNSALLTNAAVMLAVLLLSLGVTVYISKHGILNKINALRDATQKVARGDLDVHVSDYVSGGEIGELGQSFDDMAQALIRDNAERKRAEEAVREIENIFNLFLEYSPIYIFFKDEQIRAIKLSRNYEQLLGRPVEELLGRTMDDLFPSELARSMIADDQRILREGVPVQVEETLNGRIYSTLKFPIIQEGRTPMLAGFTMDITVQKQAEKEILRLNSELEQRVHTRTAQLQEAFKEQEAFNYSVSHDLRAPLRHINSFSAMLQEEFGDLLPEKAHVYLERIEKASSRMGELIDDLLQLSRVSRAEMRQVPVNLSDIARHVAEMLQGTRPDRAVEYVIADGMVVRGDPTLLRLALENLLGNAWKYTGQRQSACIEFGRTTVDGRDVYFVRDNGAGFDMAYVGKLFHPFQRLHGQEFEGTGIGLATVRRIVERHNGRIWGEGTEGEGATFYFSLGQSPEEETTNISTSSIVGGA